MKTNLLNLLLIACSLSFTNMVKAEQTNNHFNSQFQPLDDIHQLVQSYIKQKVDQQLLEPEIKLRKLSSNLQLAKCQQPLEIFDSKTEKTAGRMTIRVLCHSPKWQVFVPVIVDGKKYVVKTAKAILKQAVITNEDVEQVLVSYKKIPSGSLVNINKAIGMRAKRAMGAGQVIKARDLQPPYWVFKNKEVTIITRIGDIEVKTKGKALENGVKHEQIAVQNLSSKKVINGIIIAPNTLLIP